MVLLAFVLVLVFLALFLVMLGYQLAVDRYQAEQEYLDQQQAALAEEWQQLDRTRRIREIFLYARRTMQTEADRQARQSYRNRDGEA